MAHFKSLFSSWSEGVNRCWINHWELGRSVFGPVTPVRVWLQERRYVAEDAVLSVEDGDCVEAAEKPPELMPGEEDRTDSEPIKEHAKTTVSIIMLQ